LIRLQLAKGCMKLYIAPVEAARAREEFMRASRCTSGVIRDVQAAWSDEDDFP